MTDARSSSSHRRGGAAAPAGPGSERSPLDPVEALVRALSGQLAQVRDLGVAIERLQEAIRRADGRAIPALVQTEQEAVRRLEGLDLAARRLAIAAARRLEPDAAGPPSVRRIAALAGGETGRRLAELVEALPAEVARVRALGAVAADAADRLARHAGGLVGSLRRAAGSTQLYEARGRVAESAPLERRVDVTT